MYQAGENTHHRSEHKQPTVSRQLLAASIANYIYSHPELTSATFGLELIAGAPLVRFQLGSE